jgi:hypothetical protein
MKNSIKFFVFAALAALIVFAYVSCNNVMNSGGKRYYETEFNYLAVDRPTGGKKITEEALKALLKPFEDAAKARHGGGVLYGDQFRRDSFYGDFKKLNGKWMLGNGVRTDAYYWLGDYDTKRQLNESYDVTPVKKNPVINCYLYHYDIYPRYRYKWIKDKKTGERSVYNPETGGGGDYYTYYYYIYPDQSIREDECIVYSMDTRDFDPEIETDTNTYFVWFSKDQGVRVKSASYYNPPSYDEQYVYFNYPYIEPIDASVFNPPANVKFTDVSYY